MRAEEVISNLQATTIEQSEPIISRNTMIVSYILTIFQVLLPLLFVIVTAIIIVYDVKSKASTTKKTIISIIGIGIIPVIWIIITILKVALAVA